ncbi:uncharacterized protein V6R79_000627 [Siganus canaliculatus]
MVEFKTFQFIYLLSSLSMSAMGSKESKPEPPPPSPKTLPKAWRQIPWENKEKDLQLVKNYQPHNQELPHLRILLHGPAGSGKSSFINTVDSLLQGRMTSQALADAISKDSFTLEYRSFKIKRGQPGVFHPFTFTDIMGLESEEKTDNKGVCVEDIILAMDGHIKDGYTFNPVQQITEDHQYYNQGPTLKDKVHVLVCVISAATTDLLKEQFFDKMRKVRVAARDRGIPQVAILTKIDAACPEVKKDITNAYKSKLIKRKMETINVSLGIPMNCIFPVWNYHEEIDTDDHVDALTASALKHIITFGEDFVNGK